MQSRILFYDRDDTGVAVHLACGHVQRWTARIWHDETAATCEECKLVPAPAVRQSIRCHANVGSTWRTSTIGHEPSGKARRANGQAHMYRVRKAGPCLVMTADQYAERALVRSIARDMLALIGE